MAQGRTTELPFFVFPPDFIREVKEAMPGNYALQQLVASERVTSPIFDQVETALATSKRHCMDVLALVSNGGRGLYQGDSELNAETATKYTTLKLSLDELEIKWLQFNEQIGKKHKLTPLPGDSAR